MKAALLGSTALGSGTAYWLAWQREATALLMFPRIELARDAVMVQTTSGIKIGGIEVSA